MGRPPCREKVGLRKGQWTQEEDQKLVAYIEKHGHGSWRALPAKAGLQRCGKSCRLRWTNYLRPDIKRGKFSLQEQQIIIQLHALLGNRWSAIANHLPKRTDNEIKNYWNTHLKKRLTKMGIDPVTHKPRMDGFGSDHSKDVANLSHMTQWESARLEAEARLARESKQRQGSSHNSIVTTYHQSLHTPDICGLLITDRISSQRPAQPCLDVLKAWQGSFCNSSAKTNGTNYPMMFATDDLESPTSTLSFCGNVFPAPTSCRLGLMNQGPVMQATTTVTDTCTAAGVIACEAVGGSKTGNATDGVIQQYCDDQYDNIASWSMKPDADNDGNDAVITEDSDLIMSAYSVEESSRCVKAAANGSTIPPLADHNAVSTITNFQHNKMEAPYFGDLINFEHENHNHMTVCNDEQIGNDEHSLENNDGTNYWNSILLNLVHASPYSPVF